MLTSADPKLQHLQTTEQKFHTLSKLMSKETSLGLPPLHISCAVCVCRGVCVYIYPWKHPNNLYERVIGNWTSEHSSVLFPTEVYYHTHTTHYPRDMQGTSSTNPKASHHCFRMEHLPRPTPKQSFPVLLSVMKTSRCWLESSQLGTDLEQK